MAVDFPPGKKAEALALLDQPVLARLGTAARKTLQPLGQVLHFLMWHETYHTGQLELLRQLAGKNDQVI